MDADLRLSEEQTRVADDFCSYVNHGLLIGQPGTGKSKVTTVILDALIAHGFSVLVVALTNLATEGYEVPTANFEQVMFALRSKKRDGSSSVGRFLWALKKGKPTCLVIDEVFMISAQQLAELDGLLCKFRVGKTDSVVKPLFGGASKVLLLGDKGQLKPINGNLADEWPRIADFSVYELIKNFRQRDSMFTDMIASTSNFIQDPTSASCPPPEFLAYCRRAQKCVPPADALVCGWRRKDVNQKPAEPDPNIITLKPSKLSKTATLRDQEESALKLGSFVRLKTNAKLFETDSQRTPNGKLVCNGSTVQFIDCETVVGGVCEMSEDTCIVVKAGDEIVTLQPRGPYPKTMGQKPPPGFIVPIQGMETTTMAIQGTTVDGHLHFTASEPLRVPAEHVLLAVGRVTKPENFSMSPNVTLRWPTRGRSGPSFCRPQITSKRKASEIS